MKIFIHAEGASRGNSGPAAYGVVLKDAQSMLLVEIGKAIGISTNNEAEYAGLLAGLEAAIRWSATEAEIELDSKLLVGQLTANYKMRAENLHPLNENAKRIMKKLTRVRVKHVPRAETHRADELANAALDRNTSR